MLKKNCGIEMVLLSTHNVICFGFKKQELEDLKVLRRSPDLLNNVMIGQGQLQLIMEQILFYHIWGLQPFWPYPSNSPKISEKKMFR